MHTLDILEYGHQTIIASINDFSSEEMEKPGVCGVWSVKDIMAHLTSFEHLLLDVIDALKGNTHTPTLERWLKDPQAFNEYEVDLRSQRHFDSILQEYEETYHQTIDTIIRVPTTTLRQTGTLAWYGKDYDIEDFIVYTFYGHKREHAAQIAVYHDHLMGEPVWKQKWVSHFK